MKKSMGKLDERGRCGECGSTDLVAKPYTHVQRVGRYETSDKCGAAPHCAKCGALAMSLDDLAIYQMAAAKTVLYEGKYDGDVVRFGRKAIGFTQAELASVIGYTPETISAYEKNRRDIEPRYAMALAGVLSEVVDGSATPEQVLERADVSGRPSHGELRVRRMA